MMERTEDLPLYHMEEFNYKVEPSHYFMVIFGRGLCSLWVFTVTVKTAALSMSSYELRTVASYMRGEGGERALTKNHREKMEEFMAYPSPNPVLTDLLVLLVFSTTSSLCVRYTSSR